MAIAQLVLATTIGLASTQVAAINSCTSTGAYGIQFGTKPDKAAKRKEGNEASVWYAVLPPEPDSRFDKYLVRADTKTKEIFQIDAVHTVIPLERSMNTTASERDQGKSQARQFALDFIARLPPEVQERLHDKYDTAHWEGVISGTLFEISAGFAWDVTVSCRDLRREQDMARRVWPELFRKNK